MTPRERFKTITRDGTYREAMRLLAILWLIVTLADWPGIPWWVAYAASWPALLTILLALRQWATRPAREAQIALDARKAFAADIVRSAVEARVRARVTDVKITDITEH